MTSKSPFTQHLGAPARPAYQSSSFPLWPFLPSLRQGLGLPFVTLRGGGGRNGRRRRLQIGRGKVWTRRTKVGWHGRRCSWRRRGSERWRERKGANLQQKKKWKERGRERNLFVVRRRTSSCVQREIDKDSKHRTRTDAAFLPCFLHRRRDRR